MSWKVVSGIACSLPPLTPEPSLIGQGQDNQLSILDKKRRGLCGKSPAQNKLIDVQDTYLFLMMFSTTLGSARVEMSPS